MNEQRVIQIGGSLVIPESELSYETCHGSGPGGQSVNTSDSAVQLRFDVVNSPSLPEDMRIRLLGAAGKYVNAEGVLVIRSDKYRQQLRNKFAAREKFIAMLLKVALPPVPRKWTPIPIVSNEARLELKKRVSLTKRHRRKPSIEEDE